MQPTDWTPAVAILVAGHVIGILFVIIIRRRKGAALSRLELRSDLEARRDALLAQLREAVEDDRREALETEAAAVLRELDSVPDTPPARRRPPFLATHPVLKGYALGAATVAALGALAYYGSTFAEPRPPAGSSAAAEAVPASGMQQLEQSVKDDPRNVDHRVALARMYFQQDNLQGVLEQTNAVLAIRPDEPRALTYNAIVLIATGRLEEARTKLERATKLDPEFLDGWVALASLHTQAGRDAEAESAIAAAIAKHPDERARLQDVLKRMRAQKRGEGEPPATAAQLPPDHPPMPTRSVALPASSESAAAPAASPIRVTLTLDEAVARKSGVVYVIARSEGPGKGHPVAVRRIDTNSFPLSIELGGSESMMGQPLPARVRVEARLDADGDAGTTGASDPKAFAERVAAGSTIALTLK